MWTVATFGPGGVKMEREKRNDESGKSTHNKTNPECEGKWKQADKPGIRLLSTAAGGNHNANREQPKGQILYREMERKVKR